MVDHSRALVDSICDSLCSSALKLIITKNSAPISEHPISLSRWEHPSWVTKLRLKTMCSTSHREANRRNCLMDCPECNRYKGVPLHGTTPTGTLQTPHPPVVTVARMEGKLKNCRSPFRFCNNRSSMALREKPARERAECKKGLRLSVGCCRQYDEGSHIHSHQNL